ncbi:unnamed protein product [Linum tenue]|uniref:SBP-type domain-containing protein n=1 Tax=Linum tenue TaxID=586396 RepID=A0AAV0H6V2_9ROSI|nr:unnamed protein product [Linum tenue]
MTCVSVMEWNHKPQLQWDWENLIMYNPNSAENPNPRKLDGNLDWEFDDGVREAAADSGSFFSSGGCCNDNSGGSISELGLAAGSSFSSKSASITNSSSTGEAKPINTTGEPLLGLKLGKRTYFEDSSCGSNCKAGPAATVVAAAAAANLAKRSKSNCVAVFCQVEGCNLDLSAAKDYHKKHRVCEGHSKCPKVVVAGVERRFCQQCSRFHSLSEFDEKKRSCRKRLSDHNARRRKPQGESLRFNPSRMHSSIFGTDGVLSLPRNEFNSCYELDAVFRFADERQRMSFGWESSRSPLVQGRAGGYLFWEDTSGSKFTITKDYSFKPSTSQPAVSSMAVAHHHGLLPAKAKGIATDNPSQGIEAEESTMSLNANDDATQDLHRALSLLSTNSSWGSCEQQRSTTIASLEAAHASPAASVPQSFFQLPHIELQSAEARLHSSQSAYVSDYSQQSQPHQLLRDPYAAELSPGQL